MQIVNIYFPDTFYYIMVEWLTGWWWVIYFWCANPRLKSCPRCPHSLDCWSVMLVVDRSQNHMVVDPTLMTVIDAQEVIKTTCDKLAAAIE